MRILHRSVDGARRIVGRAVDLQVAATVPPSQLPHSLRPRQQRGRWVGGRPPSEAVWLPEPQGLLPTPIVQATLLEPREAVGPVQDRHHQEGRRQVLAVAEGVGILGRDRRRTIRLLVPPTDESTV